MIKTIKGDLLELFRAGKFDAIAHGCNCFHTMGAGIALQIARQFPEAEDADLKTARGAVKFGMISVAEIPDMGYIINMYTQVNPGRQTQEDLIRGITSCFEQLGSRFPTATSPAFKLGIPRIGAGIAGGDWDTHLAIIESATSMFDVTVVELPE